MNKLGFNIVDSPITIDNLSKLIKLIEENIISTRIAKDAFEISCLKKMKILKKLLKEKD